MLRERALLIVSVTLVFAAVGVYFDSRAQTFYTVTATVEIRAAAAEAPLAYARRATPQLTPEAEAAEFNKVILPGALRDLQRRLRKEHPGVALGGQPIATPAAAGLVKVGVSHADRRTGAIVAQALAESVVAELRKREVRAIDRVIEANTRGRRKLARGRTASARRFEREAAALARARLELSRGTAAGGRILVPATPGRAAAFRRGQRVLPMAVFGLCLSLVAAFFANAFNRRPRTARELAEAAELPLLAAIPRLGRRHVDEADAFQHVRAVLEHRSSSALDVVVVTSAGRGDGKSTVAAGLAEAVAAGGRSVCLVEANLDAPALGRRLGLTGPGLGEVLTGAASAEQAVTEVPSPGSGHSVGVLTAGRARPGPFERPGAEGWNRLVDELRRSYSVVVVEAPPLPGPEATAISGGATAVLMAARPRHSAVDELGAAARMLARSGAPVAGLVVTQSGSPTSDGSPEPRRTARLRRRWAASGASLSKGAP